MNIANFSRANSLLASRVPKTGSNLSLFVFSRLRGLSVISIPTPTSAQSFTTTKATICPSYGLYVDLCPAPGVPHELGTLGAKVINFNEHPGQ
jgi:hypothetical protein